MTFSSDDPQADGALQRRIASDPRYIALVRDRQRVSWMLTIITVIVYSSFISLIAFDKPFMARFIGGTSFTVAVALGAAMLLGTIAICAVYVWRANGDYDARLAALLADPKS